jgi:hypothetical protein
MQLTCVLLLAVPLLIKGFPDGAPIDACVKPKPNRPYHGQHTPQPLESLPYVITASSNEYGPGSRITGNQSINVSCNSYLEHRASTTHRHQTSFFAATFTPSQFKPTALASIWTDLLQVLFSRSLRVEPCGFRSDLSSWMYCSVK